MSKAIDAWNATVQGAAQSGSLSIILSSIFVIIYLIIGAMMFTACYKSWSKNRLDSDEAIELIARWLCLMIFSFYYLT
ncbi:hypothetical protein CTM97_16200 [Photobacterium phosphoreum]|uniref:DUF3262 domain-containing protein n=1 Tax=Photobacterium phosphoreum TaxID=659 RepID=A0A2T3JTB9_PHOPO|nr:DUF3262 family protein [Photobacterium phosphoreum]PSU21246.1 hypothetical protein CTM96_18265 [Photobacterium phosphoreum]PSU40210.1 hypothetical protein CTM97_16200 [Photobacterium phosphoreum]PSU52414.1 hypothetical protein C9J18_09735 [Photobacterium phosphoreum]